MEARSKSIGLVLLLVVLICSTGFTIGLTYAPCFSSLCTEDFFPYPTRFHIATYYALLASIGCVLLLRAYSPVWLSISEHHLTKKRWPVLGKRISAGGFTLAFWIVTVTLATTGFWVAPELAFWGARTVPSDWQVAQIRLLVTGIIGHHADILLGLVLIPVSRNSILGRVFAVHQSTLLYSHKLVAYVLVVAVFAHGVAYYTFVGTYAATKDDSPRKDLFNVDNPTLTTQQTEARGSWSSATLATGMISFLAMFVITITALPVLRRRAYNTFYYLHIILSTLIFVSASLHASTNFYFLLPGLLLWVLDWAWRFFRGDTGIRKGVVGELEDAGSGWYRISLPTSAKSRTVAEPVETSAEEENLVDHPLQSYYLNVPSVSKLQNHAFTAAKVGSSVSGPVILFQRAQGDEKTKQSKQEKEWTWKAGSLTGKNDGDSGGVEKIHIRVEGPYIPTEVTEFQSADHIVCVVGGTGLTGAYSLADWWLRCRTHDVQSRFTLIWTIRHRDTAKLREWQELEERAKNMGSNIRLVVHVSSEGGRLDVMKSLRDTFVRSDEKEDTSGQKAWVYVSGPAGLLNAAEDACIDLERELNKARKENAESTLAVRHMEHYIAKWEV